MASVREFAPWINAMVVAGVIGTAITADLGARRIREEIDAMEVLGIDPVRSLVLPRVIALFIITGALDLVALSFGIAGGWIASVPLLGATSGGFFANFFANATVTDLWGSVLKTAIFGLIIAIVCCYKGLNAKGGPAGVGRAVNQAVVIAFAADLDLQLRLHDDPARPEPGDAGLQVTLLDETRRSAKPASRAPQSVPDVELTPPRPRQPDQAPRRGDGRHHALRPLQSAGGCRTCAPTRARSCARPPS